MFQIFLRDFKIPVNGSMIKIRKGDLLEVKTDVLVCPSNPTLQPGFGVSGLIESKGGSEIFEEAEKKALEYAKKNGRDPVNALDPGSAVFTGAGRLRNARYVSHVVSALYSKELGNYTTKGTIYGCVVKTLAEADERQLKSVAFPLIGAGIGNMDKIESAKAIVEASVGFIRVCSAHVNEVIVVVQKEAFARVKNEVREVVKRLHL